MGQQAKRTHRADVMISSTTKDLDKHREAVIGAVWRAGMYALAMEGNTAEPYSDAISFSMRMVDEAEVYVGIFGKRYGFIPTDLTRNPDQISITEMEYRRAVKRDIPCLIFIMSDEHDISAKDVEDENDAIRAKRQTLHNNLLDKHIVGIFESVADLREQALQALHKLIVSGIIQIESGIEEIAAEVTPLPRPPELYSKPAYILTNKFIGRANELDKLDQWAKSSDAVIVVDAIGGQGKSALTWEWVNQHARSIMQPDGIIWWSFYDHGATVEGFIRHALAYITEQDPESLKELTYQERANQLLEKLNKASYLLAMDGVERVLVAYHRIDRAHVADSQVGEDVDLRNCTDPRDADFLRRLVTIRRSKVLISTRLMPRPLEDMGRPIASVQHIRLRGLTPEDARALLFDRIKPTHSENVNKLLNEIGYHSLLIKIIAGSVYNYRQGPRDFDRWYRDVGNRTNFATMAESDRRNHILSSAFDGLEPHERIILCQIAAFSDPVNYQMLSIFNPYRPPKPPQPKLPSLPQTRPSPFGSPQLAWLQFQFNKLSLLDLAAREEIQKQIDTQRETDMRAVQRMVQNQRALQHEEIRVKAERRRLVEQWERDYFLSDSYLAGVATFDAVLTELEDRGLLQWDRESDSYDLHPVVRGYAFAQLQTEEKVETVGRIRDHFASLPRVDKEKVREVEDLKDMIEAYRALISAGELEFAASYYWNYLSGILRPLGAHHLIIELLTPLFTEGIHTFPTVKEIKTRSYLTNHFAVVLGVIGQIEQALELHGLTLNPEYNFSTWDMTVSLSNYSETLEDFNRLAAARHALGLEAQLIDPEDQAWSYYSLLGYFLRTGQIQEAEDYYARCMDNIPPQKHRDTWIARVSLYYAKLLVLRGQDASKALEEAYKLLQGNKQFSRLSGFYALRAEDHLMKGNIQAAYEDLSEAISRAQRAGQSVTVYLSILARIYIAQGDHETSRHWLDRALNDARLLESNKADVYINAAESYIALGEPAQARRYAELAYQYAWADGEPFVRRLPLQRAERLLSTLNVPHPHLPPHNPSHIEAIPYEDAIRRIFIDKVDTLIGHPKTPPKKQSDFEMTRLTWVHVGTIATFGVNNEELLPSICEKIATLSYIPGKVVLSRMGDEVPDPDDYRIEQEHKTFGELNFTFAELHLLEKIFCIIYLESLDSDEEKVFAYVNVRMDRADTLFKQGETDTPFNLPDFSTIVLTGRGDPTFDDREKLGRDYLFAEHYTNVRIFPRLEDVT